MKKRVCQVCGQEEAKYSCPRCREAYCSVACCKLFFLIIPIKEILGREHKASQCSGTSPAPVAKRQKVSATKGRPDEFDDEQYQLPPSLVQSLNSAKWIHAELKHNPDLLSALKRIDTATSRPSALSQARSSNAKLNAFIDRVLIHLGCCSLDDQGHILFLGVEADANKAKNISLQAPSPQKAEEKCLASLKANLLAQIEDDTAPPFEEEDDEDMIDEGLVKRAGLPPPPLSSSSSS